MCSGAHLVQMDSHPSAVGSFLEAVVKCKPQPQIRSCILKVSVPSHMHVQNCKPVSMLLLDPAVTACMSSFTCTCMLGQSISVVGD